MLDEESLMRTLGWGRKTGFPDSKKAVVSLIKFLLC